jgi:hypothetical protein
VHRRRRRRRRDGDREHENGAFTGPTSRFATEEYFVKRVSK